MRAIIDPRIRREIMDHYPSICTIRLIPITRSASNQPVYGDPEPIEAMKNIPCRIGPLILIRPTDNEIRTQVVTEQYTARQLKLNGHFPQILARTHDALVDGVAFPIRGVEHDGNQLTTRLRLEVVKPRG